MKQYIGVKLIQAKPMTRGEHSVSKGYDKVLEGSADDAGYQVVYPDGYESWSPIAAFEEAYRPTDGMTFGLAIEAMKKGYKVARSGWNGKGMFLELQVPDEHSKMTFPYPYFTIPKCEEGTRRIPYASTIVDIMSEDWQIIN